jgi:DNA-directed RNA polymerase subunit M/transcription elongation factor TFIIS
MKWCPTCQNMLHEYHEKDGILFQKCRACSHEEKVSVEDPLIYEHDLRQDLSVHYAMNQYLKYDPTLPHFTNMKCPNITCPTKGKNSDVVGVELDKVNLVWQYQCKQCSATWKQSATG